MYRDDLSGVSEDPCAVSFPGNVFNVVNKFRCEEKLVTLTYDFATVMKGEQNRLQKLIRD